MTVLTLNADDIASRIGHKERQTLVEKSSVGDAQRSGRLPGRGDHLFTVRQDALYLSTGDTGEIIKTDVDESRHVRFVLRDGTLITAPPEADIWWTKKN